jgi:L-erythro-3,5-diaminohexanoate dehydrogenase
MGSPAGDHRVLEPPGARPATARRLDALGELWDGEVRVALEALVLDDADLASWRDRLGPDPTTLAAALVESVAERGALDDEPGKGTLLGRIAAVGRAHPWPAQVGERVVIPLPARVVPAFAVPGRWEATSPVIPLDGHAVAPAGSPTVLVGDASATAARFLARHADVPAALDAWLEDLGARHDDGGAGPDDGGAGPAGAVPVVLGADTVPGAIGLAHLAALGVPTWAVVEGLDGARRAEALGAAAVLIADLGDPVATAQLVATDGPGTIDLAVLADPSAAALSARLASRVLVVTEHAAAGVAATEAVAAARGVEVIVHRRPGAGRGIRVHDLVASSVVLADVLRWRTGHPAPPVSGREPPPWERT